MFKSLSNLGKKKMSTFTRPNEIQFCSSKILNNFPLDFIFGPLVVQGGTVYFSHICDFSSIPIIIGF
jgi:hypothetical protein